MTYDLIVTWPTNCDYPLWRKMIRDNRHRFNEIIVAFSTVPAHDYSDFVREAMQSDHVLFTENPIATQGDWRDIAIKSALLQSDNAEWVWFTEQDFYPKQSFWEEVDSHNEEAFAVFQADRMHPCSLFIKKEALNRTSKDFSAKPPEYDHFGRIQKDLNREGITVGKIKEQTYFHHNGLSHNWRLISEGQPPVYEAPVFYQWIHASLECGATLDDHWQITARKALLQE